MKWNLDDIIPQDKFEKLYKECEEEIKELEKWVGKVNPKMSKEEFKKMLLFEENLGEKMSKLGYLPYLRETTNQKDQWAKFWKNKVEDLSLKMSEAGRKIGLWIQGKREPILDDINAKRLFTTIPDLEYGLKRSREGARFSLEENEERIIDHKDSNGVGVLGELREMIETEFEYDLKIGKRKKHVKSQAELLSLVYSPKAKIREAAYRALLKKQKDNLDKFFAIYQGIVKDWGYEAKLRGYKSPINVRNWANHVPDEAIESLLEVCSQNVGIFQRYFKWKAKELGLKKLNRFDIYAPLEKIDKKMDFEDAKIIVLESFKEFSSKFYEGAKKIIEEKHIDVNPGKTKRSGAFCATVSSKITPYVLLNFTGKSRDISTLAHELGHGIHSLLANHHYSSSQQANLPLAETASTLAELILFEKMMETEKNNVVKKAWLSDKMADAYATICRQNYFIKFEIKAHEAIEKGISSADLSKLYFESLKEQFGKSLLIDPLFKYEWSYISHIFESPFYCYAYNFGELLSYSLWENYKKEPTKWVKIIENILADGGSRDPQKILHDAKIDICLPKFWQAGFETIQGWQEKLEQL